MLRDGYPTLYPPHDWVRQTEGELPTKPGRVTLARWTSEYQDTVTVYQHTEPDRKRKRFSVVWNPVDDAPTRTIWGSSAAVTAAHVRRTFRRVRARR